MARFLFLFVILGAFLSFSNCVFADDDKEEQTEQEPSDKQIDDNSNVEIQDSDMLGLLSVSIQANALNPALAVGMLNGMK
jgi:hypothetical protein